MLDVARRLDAQAANGDGFAWAEQVRPGVALPTLSVAGSPDTPILQLASRVWGYPLPNGGKLVYYARIENASSALWASSFAAGRSVVAVAAFFEPHRSETQRNPRSGRVGKRPYVFRSTTGDPLLLGAVANKERVSIVTTEPNVSVAPVHPRMPLVLSFDEVPAWLHGDWDGLADRSAVALACEPEYPAPSEPEQLSLFPE